jgi:hypothetical protein
MNGETKSRILEQEWGGFLVFVWDYNQGDNYPHLEFGEDGKDLKPKYEFTEVDFWRWFVLYRYDWGKGMGGQTAGVTWL